MVLRPAPRSEQALLRHISVFPDGLDLPTAETVASELDPGSVPHARTSGRRVDARALARPVDPLPDARHRAGLRRRRARRAQRVPRATERFLGWALDLVAWIYDANYTDEDRRVDRVLRRELPNLRAAWTLLRSQGRTDDAIAMVTGLLDAATWRDPHRGVGLEPRALAPLSAPTEDSRYSASNAGTNSCLTHAASQSAGRSADTKTVVAGLGLPPYRGGLRIAD